jgi:hypothetical protein
MDHGSPADRDGGAPAQAVAPLGTSSVLGVARAMGHQSRHDLGRRRHRSVGNPFN